MTLNVISNLRGDIVNSIIPSASFAPSLFPSWWIAFFGFSSDIWFFLGYIVVHTDLRFLGEVSVDV